MCTLSVGDLHKRDMNTNYINCEFAFGDTEIVVTVKNMEGTKTTHIIDFNV
jgi:hypothetical protein